jgi:hypothetical protein
MSQRFVAGVTVALAVLFCQSGGVVLAAICPHLRAQHESCHAMSEMAESHDMQPANGAAFETSETGTTCSHCMMYARNKRDDSAVEQPNSSQRANDVAVSVRVSTTDPVALLQTIAFVAKAHGPPGDSGPLYVRNNTFRI